MQNPWVHDDVPDSADATHRSRAKLFAAVLWGIIGVVVVAAVLLSGDGLTEIDGIESMGSVVTFFVGVLALAFCLPFLLKLLAFSRTLAAIAFLGTAWLVARVLVSQEAARIQAMGEDVTGGLEPIVELIELLDAVAVLL